MGNLHKVVNFSAAANDSLIKARPVNSNISPNLYVISNLNCPHLRYLMMRATNSNKTKTIL